ncbi:MAG TPA: hypothetical protein DCR50_04270, partial [Afipia sp.]|nr:hypothetical protein [Afipia sp.]
PPPPPRRGGGGGGGRGPPARGGPPPPAPGCIARRTKLARLHLSSRSPRLYFSECHFSFSLLTCYDLRRRCFWTLAEDRGRHIM